MPEAIKVQDLLHRLGQAYGQFESYQDSGYVKSIHSPDTQAENHSHLSFNTLFCRPNLFRFEWRERCVQDSSLRTSVIWCDGERTYKKYSAGKIIRCKSLPQAIAGAAGASGGSAQTVPALLMPDVDGRKLTDSTKFLFVEQAAPEFIAGEECHRLRHDAPHETDLWISSSRLIVLKIFEQYIVEQDRSRSKWLRAKALRSLPGFIRWLKMRKIFALAERDESFHVIEQTHYTSVILNEQIPKEAFSIRGLK